MSTLADYLGPEVASQLPPPNLTNPETDVSTMLGTEISLTLVMAIFVCMRFYSRLFINGLFGADDAIMGAAALTAVAHTAVTCAGTRHGIGYHLWDVDPPAAIPTGFKYTFTSILLFHPISAATKISVCFGYLRLFPGTGNLVFCWCMVAYSAMWGVASFFAVLFTCTPVNLFWNQPFSIRRDCVDVLTLLVATAALNSLGDLLVYLWPIKFLFKLQMPLKHRLGLILLFSFGCVVFAASICRILALQAAMTSVDVLYNSSTLLLIASIEENVGIICGCLPCVKGTLAHFWPRVFGTGDHRSYSPSNRSPVYNNSSSLSSRRKRRSRGRRPNFVHTGAGRVTGYGDHSHNHSTTIVSNGGSRAGGRKGSGSCAGMSMEGFELEMGGWGDGDERRLVVDEEEGGGGGGIVMTKEVMVKRSASMGHDEVGGMGRVGGGGGYRRDAGSSIGDLSTVGDVDVDEESEDVEKGSRRSV